MGRRYRSRRDDDDEEGLLPVICGLAWEQPKTGLVISAALAGTGYWLVTVPFNFTSGWHMVAPLFGIMFLLVGIAGMVVGVLGLVRSIFR